MAENNPESIVVIGASAAGLRAAARARRRLPGARVLVIDQEAVISYGACGMPYFVSGDIETADHLRKTAYGLIRDETFFSRAKDLEVLTRTVVEKIDRERSVVHYRSLETGAVAEQGYDRLVLATGAAPIRLPGAPESPLITTFKTLEDAIQLKQALQQGKIGKAGIIGGGFIGCEMAEAFASLWGVEVSLFEAAPNLLPGFLDQEMAAGVEAYLKEEGVDLHLASPVEKVTPEGDGVVISTKDGTTEVDCVIMAMGVKPSTTLAAEAGLSLGERGGIRVDERMTTSDPKIFAAGDCVEVMHLITGQSVYLPLGSLANRQGRIIGSNLAGGDEHFKPVVASAAVKTFDLNVSCTGVTEKTARQVGLDVGAAYGSFTDIAEYYPDSQNIHLKLVYEKGSHRLLGLQAYGKGEVVKRVDVFAALLKQGATLEDLLDTEFAYAPPYATALDPLFSLACVARNIENEGMDCLPPGTPWSARTVVDVRQESEAAARKLPAESQLNIPLEEIRKRWGEVPSDQPLLVVCSKGMRSAEALRILKENGISDAAYLGGGGLMNPAGPK